MFYFYSGYSKPENARTAKISFFILLFVSKRSQTNHFLISYTRLTLTRKHCVWSFIIYIENVCPWQLADEWYFNFRIQPLSLFRCWLFSCNSHRLLFIQYMLDNKKEICLQSFLYMANISGGYRVNLNHTN